MKKSRYLLYLLLCGVMLYVAMPELSFESGKNVALFSASWLLLAMLVFAGNLAAYLYTPKKAPRAGSRQKERKSRKKSRVYTG